MLSKLGRDDSLNLSVMLNLSVIDNGLGAIFPDPTMEDGFNISFLVVVSEYSTVSEPIGTK